MEQQSSPGPEREGAVYYSPDFDRGRSVDGQDPIAAAADISPASSDSSRSSSLHRQLNPSQNAADPSLGARPNIGLGIGHAPQVPSTGYSPIDSGQFGSSAVDNSPQFGDAPSKASYHPQHYVYTIPETPFHYPERCESVISRSDSVEKSRYAWLEGWRYRDTWPMYAMVCLGIIFAGSHHAFYTHLDGRPADDQIKMMRIGGLLSYIAKSSLVGAVIFAYRQQIWVTARRKRLQLKTIDSLFAAVNEFMALLNWEFARNAKVAMALAVLTWLFPLTVILTPGSLTVAPLTETIVGQCSGVRTLNFEAEKDKNWRNSDFINGYPGLSLSVWNTTMDAPTTFTPFNDTWFDYWDSSSTQLDLVATRSALAGDVVARPDVAADTCGVGWNCSYTISFVAPGYKCTEIARGRNLDQAQLSRDHGVPFNASDLMPTGDYGYIASTTIGDYARPQIDAGAAGIPLDGPPFPRNLGAFRTEPVLWIGHAVPTGEGPPPTSRNEPGFDTAFEASIIRCDHYLTNYNVYFNHTFSSQVTTVVSREFLHPIINTTFVDKTMDDGTRDNTTATPESNWIRPLDVERYRVTAGYHSLGSRLRRYLDGRIKYLPYALTESDVTQTNLIDKMTYLAVPNLREEVQRFYENITLSLFSNPQFVIVSWAAKPNVPSGRDNVTATAADPSLAYPCTKTRIANAYVYLKRDLWIAYAVAISVAIICAALGTAALAQNNYHVRDVHVSSIVAATRAPCLQALPWNTDSKWGEVPDEVLRTRMGYGVIREGAADTGAVPASCSSSFVEGSPDTDRGGVRASRVYYGFAQEEILDRSRAATSGHGGAKPKLASAFSFKTWEQNY